MGSADPLEIAAVDPPFLDHVSLTARNAQIKELGFHLNLTRGAASHARVFLERSYLEVTPPGNAEDVEIWARGWFLRPADPAEAAEVLRGKGISAVGPSLYERDDGIWLDVAIPERETSVLPILTRRVDEVVDEWPPPVGPSHTNGTKRLSAVHLEARDPTKLARVLEAIGARAENSGTFELGGGGKVIVRDSENGSEGLVALELDRADRPPLRLQVSPVGSSGCGR